MRVERTCYTCKCCFFPVGISVSDEILSQLNPLFVVNHKTSSSHRWVWLVAGKECASWLLLLQCQCSCGGPSCAATQGISHSGGGSSRGQEHNLTMPPVTSIFVSTLELITFCMAIIMAAMYYGYGMIRHAHCWPWLVCPLLDPLIWINITKNLFCSWVFLPAYPESHSWELKCKLTWVEQHATGCMSLVFSPDMISEEKFDWGS